ncbi:MAG: choice-of-anchor J domain-containing protein, partial [Bacteroidales bacterium]|nr:choice-of-anchor J domain-containing protein [Bacteroidales bacterium]
MKKLITTTVFTLALVLGFSFMVSAQNLVVNGDMESWSGGSPDGWTIAENISQETTIVYEGSSSARHISDASTKKLQQNISGIVGGSEYNISYWYLDNDSEAKTRIWSAWLNGGSTMTNHIEILHGDYSENNPAWQQFNVTLEAPAEADGFRFEVRVYNQDGNIGGSVLYDDFIVSGDIIVDPEPTNYPTGFTANASGNTIELNWTDAIGAQLPSAYIVFAGITSGLPVPVDGTPVANDTDLSDGSGAININYGVEETYFANLDPNTTYYFSIYSYTNSGTYIDYKNDGTAPTAEATTPNVTTVTIEYQNFDDGWGNWTPVSVVGTQEWVVDPAYGYPDPPCAKMTGYESPNSYENDDWLISPPLNFDNYENEKIIFYTAKGYDGPDLEFKVSTDYDGGGDPYSATWTSLPFTWSPDFFVWTESGIIDLSGYNGQEVYVAFQFTSTNSESSTWEVDEITITGEEDLVIDPEPSNYPTDFNAIASGTSIDLSWIDAIGTQLPDGYIIFAGTSSSLPVPVDGTPVANDPDLSDGEGALNVSFGIEAGSFNNLEFNTTYYFSIYSYTNSGNNIDYKNDGTAPTAEATVLPIPEPTNYPTDFSVNVNGLSIDLIWTDAIGSQLPEAYIIFAGTSSSLPTPEDGTPIADDLDLSDGLGALNVNYGIESGSFINLAPNTTYYFSIYSYTNSGAAIDYKNDGTAPTDNATTEYSPIIEYQNFDNGWEDWTIISVTGSQEWVIDADHGEPNPPCAYMSGYSGSSNENEDWLISPPLNLNNYDEVLLTFNNAVGYTGPSLELKVSTDYNGGGNPSSANWTTLSYTMSTGYFEWVESGEIDLSEYNGSAVYIAFYYTSTNSESAAWEIDEILIEEIVTFPEPSNYPTDFTAVEAGTTIGLAWADAIGTQLPEAYIIFAGISSGLPVPVDGTPVADDPDLSDGS